MANSKPHQVSRVANSTPRNQQTVQSYVHTIYQMEIRCLASALVDLLAIHFEPHTLKRDGLVCFWMECRALSRYEVKGDDSLPLLCRPLMAMGKRALSLHLLKVLLECHEEGDARHNELIARLIIRSREVERAVEVHFLALSVWTNNTPQHNISWRWPIPSRTEMQCIYIYVYIYI